MGGSGSTGDYAEVVARMCAQIVHRGPDDQGIHAVPGAAIGMRRLSIIDLAGGHQPIHNEDRSRWVVFNGEIYNYSELKQELEALGHVFYTKSDSEVIVHAYEEYGAGCFARFRGMFAIAIWDAPQRKLILARDRFGKKPLFFAHQSDGSLLFGSELKSLLAVPGFVANLDGEALRQFMLMGYVATPRSIFREVKKLEPGSWLELVNGKITTSRYWNLEFGNKHVGAEGELEERLFDEIDEAVRVRLVSDVPFGAFLSGGLDSSIVCALMAKHLDSPLRTFTIGFKEDAFDERSDARRVANHIGAIHEELVVEPNAVDLVEKLVWHLDEPFGDVSAIPTFLVSQLAASHVKMVLSGDGGDEMFGGYDRYRKYLQLRDIRRFLPGRLSELPRMLSPLLPGGAARKLRWVSRRLASTYPADYLSGVALLTPEAMNDLVGPGESGSAGYGELERYFPVDPEMAPLDRVISGDIRTYLLDDILVKVDRMSMACSLEARAPLLDHKLAEFAARLPVDLKLRDGKGKYLLRKVAARLLPPDVLAKKKQGFGVPLAQWFRGPLSGMLHDIVASRSFTERGLFDAGAVRKLQMEHMSGRVDRSEALWLILNFELWARKFCDVQQ